LRKLWCIALRMAGLLSAADLATAHRVQGVASIDSSSEGCAAVAVAAAVAKPRSSACAAEVAKKQPSETSGTALAAVASTGDASPDAASSDPAPNTPQRPLRQVGGQSSQRRRRRAAGGELQADDEIGCLSGGQAGERRSPAATRTPQSAGSTALPVSSASQARGRKGLESADSDEDDEGFVDFGDFLGDGQDLAEDFDAVDFPSPAGGPAAVGSSVEGHDRVPRRQGGSAGRGGVSGRVAAVNSGNWSPAPRSSPPPPPPAGSLKALPSDCVQRFLHLVREGEYSEALKALRKARRAVKGRGCSREAFGGLRALLHHLLEGYAFAGRMPEALELLQGMKRGAEGRLVGAAAFNALLRGLLARGSLVEARFIVREEMPRMGVSPNEASLNLLMDTAARAGPAHLDEAWDVLEEMQKRGLRADKYTVSMLTKGITDRGDKRRGSAVPRGVALVEKFLVTQPDHVDEVLVNSLLDVFCRMGDMTRLEATLQKMKEYGIRGSAVTYGTIVKAYGRSGNIEKVLQAWEEMSREGLEANAVTYGCMLDACVKCGRLDQALQVFTLMKTKCLHRNTILYATLIKGFAKSKDPGAARALHREMVREGVTCNVVVFNSLIDACVRASDLHSAAEVLQQMAAAGVQPDLITFSTLIKGYCSNGDLAKAMRLAEELQARDLQCDEIVYNSLLEGCVKAGDLQLGLRLFSGMRQQGVRPSSVTFSILVKLLARAGRLDLACQLVAYEMREMHGVAPTRMVWSCLVTCAVKAKDLTRAAAALELLDIEAGAVGAARASMYATVLEGCLAQGEVGLALGLCFHTYTRGTNDEGPRGFLSTDLLRRVFDCVGSKGGHQTEATDTLVALRPFIGEQACASLEEALAKGSSRHRSSLPTSQGRPPAVGAAGSVGGSDRRNGSMQCDTKLDGACSSSGAGVLGVAVRDASPLSANPPPSLAPATDAATASAAAAYASTSSAVGCVTSPAAAALLSGLPLGASPMVPWSWGSASPFNTFAPTGYEAAQAHASAMGLGGMWSPAAMAAAAAAATAGASPSTASAAAAAAVAAATAMPWNWSGVGGDCGMEGYESTFAYGGGTLDTSLCGWWPGQGGSHLMHSWDAGLWHGTGRTSGNVAAAAADAEGAADSRPGGVATRSEENTVGASCGYSEAPSTPCGSRAASGFLCGETPATGSKVVGEQTPATTAGGPSTCGRSPQPLSPSDMLPSTSRRGGRASHGAGGSSRGGEGDVGLKVRLFAGSGSPTADGTPAATLQEAMSPADGATRAQTESGSTGASQVPLAVLIDGPPGLC